MKNHNKNQNAITEKAATTAERWGKVPALGEVEITFTLLPVALKIKEGKKGVKKIEKFAPFALWGKSGRAPLCAFGIEHGIYTEDEGALFLREIFAAHESKGKITLSKYWENRYSTARGNLHSKAEKRLEKLEKVQREGREMFLVGKADEASEQWDKIPEKLESLRKLVKELA